MTRARAAAAWQRVVELDPRDFDTLYNLGMLLTETDRRVEALPYLRRFLAEAPPDRYSQDLPRVRALLARVRRSFSEQTSGRRRGADPRPGRGRRVVVSTGRSSAQWPGNTCGCLARGYNVLLVTIERCVRSRRCLRQDEGADADPRSARARRLAIRSVRSQPPSRCPRTPR